MILFITTIILVGFIILYNIIKYKSTSYKQETIFVLKNTLPKDYIHGTDKPFNLIDNISGLSGDYISIVKTTKIVFNKEVESKLSIHQEYYYDYDDFFEDGF